MFFKNALLILSSKFLWVGLLFGIASIVIKFVAKLFRNNFLIVNLLGFVFWIAFGGTFAILCLKMYNYTFCWFGLLAMFVGIAIVKISIEFFFDYFVLFIYNEIKNINRRHKNGKLQTNKKI